MTALCNEAKVEAAKDDFGPPFKYWLAYRELSNHPKFLMGLNSSPSRPNTDQDSISRGDLRSSADELLKTEDVIADPGSQPVGLCKAKESFSCKKMLLKKLKFAAEAVEI